MLPLVVLAACSGSTLPVVDSCRPTPGAPEIDVWGGDGRGSFEATGYFRATRECGRWWLVDPDGGAFYSLGVNTVTRTPTASQTTGVHAYSTAVEANYADGEAWADAQAARFAEWGLNTVGSWSEVDLFLGRVPTTVNLALSGGDWETGAVADWWSAEWEGLVRERVAAGVRPGDPWVLGYFLDNEIRWGRDWRGSASLVELYLELPSVAPGKAVAVGVLLDRHGGLDGVNEALATAFASEAELSAATTWEGVSDDAELVSAFLTVAAERYFSFTTDAVRAADPDHLVLGNRESAPVTRREVYAAAAASVDVVSINNYVYDEGIVEAAMALSDSVDPSDFAAAIAPELDRPFLVTEFGFRADDAGLPNSWPPFYPNYASQAERADAFEEYARAAQAATWVVGYHWFEFVDQW